MATFQALALPRRVSQSWSWKRYGSLPYRSPASTGATPYQLSVLPPSRDRGKCTTPGGRSFCSSEFPQSWSSSTPWRETGLDDPCSAEEYPPRSGRWKPEGVSRAAVTVDLPSQPDEALDAVLGEERTGSAAPDRDHREHPGVTRSGSPWASANGCSWAQASAKSPRGGRLLWRQWYSEAPATGVIETSPKRKQARARLRVGCDRQLGLPPAAKRSHVTSLWTRCWTTPERVTLETWPLRSSPDNPITWARPTGGLGSENVASRYLFVTPRLLRAFDYLAAFGDTLKAWSANQRHDS